MQVLIGLLVACLRTQTFGRQNADGGEEPERRRPGVMFGVRQGYLCVKIFLFRIEDIERAAQASLFFPSHAAEGKRAGAHLRLR